MWWARLGKLDPFDNLDVNMVFAMGCDRETIEATIASGSESVVAIDTTKLLMIRDENDNAAINLVEPHCCIDGNRDLSLMRASSVVKRQST